LEEGRLGATGGIWCDINDASPGPQHLRTGEDGEQFHGSRQLVFDDMEATPLCVGVEGVFMELKVEAFLSLLHISKAVSQLEYF
jgi:hypothetical protein